MQKKSIYVNRLESVIFSACNCVVYRPELNTKDGGCVCVCGGGGGKVGGVGREIEFWRSRNAKMKYTNK